MACPWYAERMPWRRAIRALGRALIKLGKTIIREKRRGKDYYQKIVESNPMIYQKMYFTCLLEDHMEMVLRSI